MHILSVSGENMYLQNVELFPALTLYNGTIEFPSVGQFIATGTDQAELQKRFIDIVDAIASGDVTVYDTREAVGYWKPKPAAKKKAAAKKPASPPEPPSHEPKK